MQIRKDCEQDLREALQELRFGARSMKQSFKSMSKTLEDNMHSVHQLRQPQTTHVLHDSTGKLRLTRGPNEAAYPFRKPDFANGSSA
jgi:hypothetical protein